MTPYSRQLQALYIQVDPRMTSGYSRIFNSLAEISRVSHDK